MIQGQEGFTLIELLVAMPIAVLLLGLVIQSLGQASHDQQDIERRTQMQTDAQIGLESMLREVRQATWLQFRSSSVVDINVRVRTTAADNAVARLVRYDCSGDTCIRSEGPAVTYPPPVVPLFERTEDVIGAAQSDRDSRRGYIVRHDIFRPTDIDPATGVSSPDFLSPDFLFVRMQLEVDSLPGTKDRAVTIEDGVSLRNVAEFAP